MKCPFMLRRALLAFSLLPALAACGGRRNNRRPGRRHQSRFLPMTSRPHSTRRFVALPRRRPMRWKLRATRRRSDLAIAACRMPASPL